MGGQRPEAGNPRGGQRTDANADRRVRELVAALQAAEARNAELEARCAEEAEGRRESDARCADLESRNAELEARCAEEAEGRRESDARCADLESRNAELEARNARVRARCAEEEEGRANAEAELADLKRTVFGRKSETQTPPGEEAPAEDSSGENPPASDPVAGEDAAGEEPKTVKVKEHFRRPRGRQKGSPTPPRVDYSHLPERIERRDVPEEERRCPCCDTAYRRDGHKRSWRVEVLFEAYRRIILHQRYRPACDCEGAGRVIAPPEPRLKGSPLGCSVWAWLIVQVYALYRPMKAAARDLLAKVGVRAADSTVCTNLRKYAQLFEPLVEAIGLRQRETATVAHADETSWPVQDSGGGGGGPGPRPKVGKKEKYWLWICVAADTVRMRILPTRSAISAETLLGPLVEAGRILLLASDMYSAYKAFARRHPGQVLPLWCWAHARRAFVRAATGHSELEAWSEAWLERIGELFHLAKRRAEEWQSELPLEEQGPRFHALQKRLEAALEDLFRKAHDELGELKRKWEVADGVERALINARGKPLGSLVHHEEGLRRFAQDPALPLDNNLAERLLRGPVIARKTCFGSGSPEAAEARARMFSVLATMQLAGLNPYTFVLDYLTACARNGSEAPANLDPWLPWRMDRKRLQELSKPPSSWVLPDGDGTVDIVPPDALPQAA